ncbi:hypothetical protein LXL04_013535 [Taraxacum kok-saghyz]
MLKEIARFNLGRWIELNLEEKRDAVAVFLDQLLKQNNGETLKTPVAVIRERSKPKLKPAETKIEIEA